MGGVAVMRYDVNDPVVSAALLAKAGKANISQEQIQQAVNEYLTENPVQAQHLVVTGTTLSLEEV